MPRVGVVGIGHGVFGRRSDATVQELAFEAFRLAMQDAGIERSELDATIIAAVPEYHKQRSVAGVVQEYLDLNPRPTWAANCKESSSAQWASSTMTRAGRLAASDRTSASSS